MPFPVDMAADRTQVDDVVGLRHLVRAERPCVGGCCRGCHGLARPASYETPVSPRRSGVFRVRELETGALSSAGSMRKCGQCRGCGGPMAGSGRARYSTSLNRRRCFACFPAHDQRSCERTPRSTPDTGTARGSAALNMRTRLRLAAFALALTFVGTACTHAEILIFIETTTPTRTSSPTTNAILRVSGYGCDESTDGCAVDQSRRPPSVPRRLPIRPADLERCRRTALPLARRHGSGRCQPLVARRHDLRLWSERGRQPWPVCGKRVVNPPTGA